MNTQYKPKKAVIIGGGFSGLAAAALMAKDGWDVTLLEKNKTVGGRARVLQTKGFRFDMGPSWYLMPGVFERFFAEFGRKTTDFYQLVRLDPRYQLYFGHDVSVSMSDAIEQNYAWFDTQEANGAAKLKQYLAARAAVYQAAAETLIYADIWDWRIWLQKKFWIALGSLFHFRVWESWHAGVARRFRSDRLQKALGFPAVFLGGSPFETPSLYSILCWTDFHEGVWYPKGGMGKVVDAVVRLAKEYHATILTNREATAIEVKDGRVVGVQTQSGRYDADVVIGAGDLPHMEMNLLPARYQSFGGGYWQQKKLGISALLLYLGTNKRLRGIQHHSIYFAPHWKKTFKELFEKKMLPKDPSLYISTRSVTDRSIVPPGAEELFVLVPLDARGSYSQKQLLAYRDVIIKKIEKLLHVSIRNHLVVNEMFTPKQFEKEYNAYQTTALGLAHTYSQSLWGRPPNKSRKVKGLYYVGQYTNPGVGVPMALVSAQIVAEMIRKTDQLQNSVFKKGSTTYYYSSIFFSGQVKKDVFALYSYVRIVDDYVDSPTPDIKQFERMWKETMKEHLGGRSNNRVVRSFVELVKRKGFEWSWVEGFWDAMRSDLHKKHYTSYRELESYMYGSAEVIGFMMARILDLSDKALVAAGKQGRAMQYINFVRDVKEDEELGRNYLGYTSAQRSDPQKWSAFIQSCIRRYHLLQKQAEVGYQYIPKNHRIPIKTAADMYTWTAQKIYDDPTIVWDKKIKPSKYIVLKQIIMNAIGIS